MLSNSNPKPQTLTSWWKHQGIIKVIGSVVPIHPIDVYNRAAGLRAGDKGAGDTRDCSGKANSE